MTTAGRELEGTGALPIDNETPSRHFVADFCESGIAVVALFVFVGVALAALFAPLISIQNPYDLAQIDILDGTMPPGSESASGATYLLGTDDQGRDMVSAILYGLRISLGVGAISGLAAILLGIFAGITAAYMGGRIDALVMRVVDVQLGFPAILIALILLAVLGRGVDKVIIALIASQWVYYARALRRFRYEVERLWRKWLGRRSWSGRMSWERFTRLLKHYPLPPVRVVHSVYR